MKLVIEKESYKIHWASLQSSSTVNNYWPQENSHVTAFRLCKDLQGYSCLEQQSPILGQTFLKSTAFTCKQLQWFTNQTQVVLLLWSLRDECFFKFCPENSQSTKATVLKVENNKCSDHVGSLYHHKWSETSIDKDLVGIDSSASFDSKKVLSIISPLFFHLLPEKDEARSYTSDATTLILKFSTTKIVRE